MTQLAPILLTQVALLVGGPVPVTCQANLENPNWDGSYNGTTIAIRTPLCRAANHFALVPVLRGDPRSDNDPAWALTIIAHETAHAKHPEYSEPAANCAALTNAPSMARALGASRETAINIYLRARYWMRSQPKNYQSKCNPFRISPRAPGIRRRSDGR